MMFLSVVGQVICFTVMLMASRSADAFSFPIPTGPSKHSSTLTTASTHPVSGAKSSSATTVILAMSEDTSGEMKGDDDTSTSSSTGDVETGEKDDETSPPPVALENTELTALKEEISKLEATLAYEKSKLETALDECEEYSKTGYARKVADMENMRRVRSVSVPKKTSHGCVLFSVVVLKGFILCSNPGIVSNIYDLEHCFF
jgi:hypothetical protein